MHKFTMAIAALAVVLACAAPVFADDAFIGCTGDAQTGVIDTIVPVHYGDMIAKTFNHDDLDPFKGSVNAYVVNDTDGPWSDFHFSLFSREEPFGVIFRDGTNQGVNPIFKLNGVDQTGFFSWNINNNAPGGPVLDMVFNSGHFIQTGDTAYFKLYTDNTATQKKFGLSMYPTSDTVPEPSSILALSTALVGFVGLGLKRKH